METYQIISATGVLPQTATQALTNEVNRYASMGYTVDTTVNINEIDRGSAFVASVVLVKK